MYNAFTFDQVQEGLKEDPRVKDFGIRHDPDSNRFIAWIEGSDKRGKLKKTDLVRGEGTGETQLEAYKQAWGFFQQALIRARDAAAEA